MKVNLIKEAYYDINEKKSSKLPFNTFMKMCGTSLEGNQQSNEKSATEVTPPNVRIFSKIDDFRLLSKKEIDKLDTTQDVIVLPSGDFCIFLKSSDENEVNSADNTDKAITEENTNGVKLKTQQDATTDTKENTENNATDL